MIDVKQAVRAAVKFAEDLYPEEGRAARLEEIELSSDERYWLVTLGLPAGLPSRAVLETFAGVSVKRDYKVFKVDAESGTVVAMKIRDAA